MPVRHSAALSVAVLLSVAGSASGQAGAPVYRSAFDGYRPFSDQAVVPWREANELVGRIGGWQAYAREGQGTSGKPPAPAASAASGAGSHSGHKTP